MNDDMNFEDDEQAIKEAALRSQTAPTQPQAAAPSAPRAPRVAPVADGQATVVGGGYTGFGGTTGTEADGVRVERPASPVAPDANTRLDNGRIVRPGDTVRRDRAGNAVGESRSQYGGYTRIVDQGTGAERWELNGKAVEAPTSMRMMTSLNGSSASDAYYNRQAWRQMKDESRQRVRANYNLSVGENMVNAFGDLRRKIGSADGIVRGADGQQYHEAMIGADELGAINKRNLGMGSYDSISRVYVRQRVDNEGNPVRGADGKPVGPDFIVEFVKDGNRNGGVGEKWTRRFNAGQVAKIMSDGYQKGGGMSERDAHVNTVRQMGMNPLDWADAKDAYDKNREEMRFKYAKMNNDFMLGVYKNAADIVSSMSGGRKDVSKMSNGELAPAIVKTLLADEKFIGNLGNVQRVDADGNPVMTVDANGNEVPDMVWDQQTFANNLNGLIEQVRGQSGRFAELADAQGQQWGATGGAAVNPVETFGALVRAMSGKEASYPGIMQAIQQVTGANLAESATPGNGDAAKRTAGGVEPAPKAAAGAEVTDGIAPAATPSPAAPSHSAPRRPSGVSGFVFDGIRDFIAANGRDPSPSELADIRSAARTGYDEAMRKENERRSGIATRRGATDEAAKAPAAATPTAADAREPGALEVAAPSSGDGEDARRLANAERMRERERKDAKPLFDVNSGDPFEGLRNKVGATVGDYFDNLDYQAQQSSEEDARRIVELAKNGRDVEPRRLSAARAYLANLDAERSAKEQAQRSAMQAREDARRNQQQKARSDRQEEARRDLDETVGEFLASLD